MPVNTFKSKKYRHQKIMELIENRAIDTQEDLVRELEKEGIIVTQATLSRDMKELGIIKLRKATGNFYYKIANEFGGSEHEIRRKFIDFVREIKITGNLVIIKTPPGEAQGVARAIDLVELKYILGTIGGDDTILVVVDTPEHAKLILKKFRDFLLKPKTTR